MAVTIRHTPASSTSGPSVRTPGRRFFLPPGYSLGLKVRGKGHEFRWTKVGDEAGVESPSPFKSGEEAAGAAWDDAGLPRPARLSEAC